MRLTVEVIAEGSSRLKLVDTARELASTLNAYSVEVELIERDAESKTLKIVVEAGDLDLKKLEDTLLKLGLILHEIKRVAVKTSR